ncbi:MAG: ribosome maturation factor RimP [Fibrobacter sp.]|nr:ribosome maturation factor RimP [Fibrobacter sp.]
MEYRTQLDKMIQEVCADMSVELVEFDMFQAGRRKLLRLYIDAEDGISVENCAQVSRELGARLDLENIFEEPYTLEVSSPGLDRPLKTDRDFQRNLNRLIKVTQGAGTPVIGYLKAVDADKLVLEVKKTCAETAIQRADILVAKVEAEL